MSARKCSVEFMRNFRNDYNADGKEKRREARERAGNKCIRCNSPSVPGRILTTHHFDVDKSNDEWWNLLALCQVCHLQIQGRVDPEMPWFLEHSEWLKTYVAGFYAWKYEHRKISRLDAEIQMDCLLAYELAGARNSGSAIEAHAQAPRPVRPTQEEA